MFWESPVPQLVESDKYEVHRSQTVRKQVPRNARWADAQTPPVAATQPEYILMEPGHEYLFSHPEQPTEPSKLNESQRLKGERSVAKESQNTSYEVFFLTLLRKSFVDRNLKTRRDSNLSTNGTETVKLLLAHPAVNQEIICLFERDFEGHLLVAFRIQKPMKYTGNTTCFSPIHFR